MNDLYLKVHGVNGESKDTNHPGWTHITSYNWGAQRKGRSKSPVHYRNLTVYSTIDKSTAAILQLASNGNQIKEVILSACKAGGSQIEFYRITLQNVIVAEVLFNDMGDMTSVEYEFQADQIKLQYWEQNVTGGKGAETRAGWDVKNATSI